MSIKNTVLENVKNSRFARERKNVEKEYNHVDVNAWLAKKTAGLAAAGKIKKLVQFVKKAQKPKLDDTEFNSALEQLNAGAIDKAYILDGYSLTYAQRVAVEAQ